jgi:hypothetical protein
MSHFSVLVKVNKEAISDDPTYEEVVEVVAERLAPYVEQCEVDDPENSSLFEFDIEVKAGDAEEEAHSIIEQQKEWTERIKKRIAEEEGKLEEGDEVPFNLKNDREQHQRNLEDEKEYARLLEEGKYEEIVSLWYGSTRDKFGNWGYWYNPNAKWDWWVIGGRWKGFLVTKPNTSGILGEPGVFERMAEGKDKEMYQYTSTQADIARFKDIDFEALAVRRREEFEQWWDRYEKEIKDIHLAELTDEEVKKREENMRFVYGIPEDVNTKEDYMKKFTTERLIHTFAVVEKDGSWHEEGEMGWFALVSNEKPDWKDNFDEAFIQNEDPDTLFVIVDCHI